MVRAFQQARWRCATATCRWSWRRPGLALGGGCEMALHADRVQAAAETYMGLVEVGVGLIPAGGGTKEMSSARWTRRADAAERSAADGAEGLRDDRAWRRSRRAAPMRGGSDTCDATDGFTMNRERLIADAKAKALDACATATSKPAPRGRDSGRRRVARRGAEARRSPGVARRHGLRDHDALIGRTLAHIFAGGDLPHATTVSEQHLLDLEREAFLSLLGEREDAGAHPAHAEDRQAAEELDVPRIIDRGSGAPLVMVPGIQGRWEWMAPAVDALPQHCRVITSRCATNRPAGSRSIRRSRRRELPRAGRRGARSARACDDAVLMRRVVRRPGRGRVRRRVTRSGSPRWCSSSALAAGLAARSPRALLPAGAAAARRRCFCSTRRCASSRRSRAAMPDVGAAAALCASGRPPRVLARCIVADAHGDAASRGRRSSTFSDASTFAAGAGRHGRARTRPRRAVPS